LKNRNIYLLKYWNLLAICKFNNIIIFIIAEYIYNKLLKYINLFIYIIKKNNSFKKENYII